VAALPVSMAGRQCTAMRHDSALGMVVPSLDVHKMTSVPMRELLRSSFTAIPTEHQPTEVGRQVLFFTICVVAKRSNVFCFASPVPLLSVVKTRNPASRQPPAKDAAKDMMLLAVL
jgi:hypothetical protein